MTEKEYVDRRRTSGREAPKYDALALFVFVAFAMIGIPLSRYTTSSAMLIYLSLVFLCTLAYLACTARWTKRTGPLCDVCRKPMLGRIADVDVAGDACLHCKNLHLSGSFKNARAG